MDGEACRGKEQDRTGGWRFLLGCTLAVALLAGLAESFLRLFPPQDLHVYLGEASPLTGPFVPDDDFGLRYRSWDALHADYAERLAAFGPFHGSPSEPPVWAFFGNSFVQAPGMLADTARATVHERRIFNLGRNEPLEVRLGQIKELLEHGLQPERIFVVLMPVDVTILGNHPLATLQVTSRGALTRRPRLPGGPPGWGIEHSRLAFTAWCRTGWQRGNPRFNRRTLYQGVGEPLRGDLDRLFGNLARLTRERQIPVTVILIPAYHQVLEGASFGFQDGLGTLFRQQGLDVLDPREAFRSQPDPAGLYLPDLHLAPRGNQLLLGELLAHVHAPQGLARAARKGKEP